ncbi:MAG TPA: ABC transporter permease, partial [Bryobacteraceae bacterium]|nr:ABC transporter permease [Bryobacteraceae bacterium]
PFIGGGDKGVPSDLVPAWASHSHLLEGVAFFNISRKPVSTAVVRDARPLLVFTEAKFFDIVGVKPAAGNIPHEDAIVLDHAAWLSLTHADPAVLGSKLHIGGKGFETDYRVAAVLPSSFRFLSRQPTVYLVQRVPSSAQVLVLARLKPGVEEKQLDRELTQIAQNVCYYFLKSQLRYQNWNSALLIPFRMFGVAALVACLIAAAVFRLRPKHLRAALQPENRAAAAHRAIFFAAKVTLALAVVFIGCLEWSRSESAVLLGSRDPGGGPFLLWLYILGAMGVLFWAVADQRARCRVCLRLLAFPVRIGCPGCLLLDWSGTELFCSEGHGILHVPHLSPSWDEASERWISLDDSWRDLFAHEK